MLYYNHANNKKCVQKVGELLNKYEIAIDVFNKVGNIAKTADLNYLRRRIKVKLTLFT